VDKKLSKIRHFIFKTKSLALTVAISFHCKVTTPTVMHSGHCYKANSPLTASIFAPKFFIKSKSLQAKQVDLAASPLAAANFFS
jgi:hypothetical protein